MPVLGPDDPFPSATQAKASRIGRPGRPPGRSALRKECRRRFTGCGRHTNRPLACLRSAFLRSFAALAIPSVVDLHHSRTHPPASQGHGTARHGTKKATHPGGFRLAMGDRMASGVADGRSPAEVDAFRVGDQGFTWHRAAFAGGYPPTIIAAAAFHIRVRDGSEWDHSAMDTRIVLFLR